MHWHGSFLRGLYVAGAVIRAGFGGWLLPVWSMVSSGLVWKSSNLEEWWVVKDCVDKPCGLRMPVEVTTASRSKQTCTETKDRLTHTRWVTNS